MESNTYNLQNLEKVTSKKRLLIKHFKPYIWSLLLILVLLLCLTLISHVIRPQLLKYALDVDILNKDVSGLTKTVLIYSGFCIVSILFDYFRIRVIGILSQKVLFNIRREVFSKIQTLPTRFFSENQTGDNIQRLTGNVETISNFFSEGLIRLTGIGFDILVLTIVMGIIDWRLALVSVIGGFLIVLFLLIQGELIEKPIEKALKEEGNISSSIQETLDGFIAIKLGNQVKNWSNKFKVRNDNYYNIYKKVAFLTSLSDGFLGIVTLLGIGVTLLLSLRYYTLGEMSIGTVIIFFGYSQGFFRSFNGISEIWRSIKTGIASADRLESILSLENNIKSKKDAYVPNVFRGDIEFIDVDFSYDKDSKVLEDIDIKAKAGDTIAIVGPTGGGKTTFVNLIARLYDTDSGKILVDGVDVKDWDIDTLRNGIGYLIQDTFLFEDTIINNLRYDNPDITEDEALDMFRQLGSESFILSLEKGLNTKLKDKANNISSGQRQIIALARILLRDPKILILDEATARIDTKSEKMLQRAIEIATKNKTTFIIAHRLSTIFNADKIILISDNRILEQGSHKDLINMEGAYYEMYSKFVGN